MRLTIINGNVRHGSTWHSADQLRQALARRTGVEVREFSLPRDLPQLCNGCFTCFYKGEQNCPHAASVAPIIEAITSADVVVLTSPVYGMDVSGAMKSLIDHLCFMWMSHRPNPGMFSKIGVTVATTAGAGLGHTTRTMRSSLRFWGCKRLHSLRFAVSAMKWDDVAEKRRAEIERAADRLAARIVREAARIERIRAPLFRSIFFSMMRNMMRKNDWNPRDRQHWVAQGWIQP